MNFSRTGGVLYKYTNYSEWHRLDRARFAPQAGCLRPGLLGASPQEVLNEALDSFERCLKLDPNHKNAKIWSFFVRSLLSGASKVQFTYQGVLVTFCITGKNLAVELAYMNGHFYEVSELEFVRQNLGPNSVIADVGCNTGNHLVYFAKFGSAAKVIPLEFHPRVIELLKKNISLNEIACADLSKLGCAVGRRRGKASLKEHPAQDLCLTEVWETEDGEIDILPLDELIAEKVDLIKIEALSVRQSLFRNSLAAFSSQRKLFES